MSKLLQPFDPNQFDPTQTAGSLPVGRHPVVIIGDEVKANKSNDGGFLLLTLKITDGPQAGATGPYRLNLYNTSQKAVEIAHKQFSAICHVVGQFQLGSGGTDTSVLYNIPFYIEVAPQKNDPQYTEVVKVFDVNGNEPGSAPAQQPQQPAQQPAQQPQQAWGSPPAQPTNPVQQPTPAEAPAWNGQQPQQPAQQPQQPATTAAPWGAK